MENKLFIVETDPVPEPIKTALLPYQVQYGNQVKFSDCEFVTEYRNTTDGFLEFVVYFFETNIHNEFDVYQMKISRKDSSGKINPIDLGLIVNRIMSAIIVKKDIYATLGEKKCKTFTSQQVYYANETQIRYLIKELSISKLSSDTELAQLYSEKLTELSELIKWEISEKYLRAVRDSHSNQKDDIVKRKKGKLASDFDADITWGSIIRSIALKTGLLRIYRNFRKK